jgi:large subunit ribosomal protein L15
MKQTIALSRLPKIVSRSKKRLGRGHGSGKVKTSGRGTKGQKARDSITPGFEGGQLALVRRLPVLRGKGKNASQKERAFALPVAKLQTLEENTKVTPEALVKAGLVDVGTRRIKLVGKGPLAVKLSVEIPASAAAVKAIVKAGGTVHE